MPQISEEPLTADIHLELETVETGKFGNNFDGVSDDDGVVTASFADTGSTIYLSFDGFDVDQGDEIELFLNGTSLGFLEAGVNNATAPYVFEITPEMQNAGGVNELRFEQAIDPGWTWGVTNILVSETEPTVPQPTDIQLELETVETGKFGNRYDGVSDADGVVTASFADTGSTIYLSFDGFDVDQGDEIELFLNGTSLGFLEAGVNNATAPYVFEITPEMQNAGGVNELRFEQAIDPGWTWGVTNILVSETEPTVPQPTDIQLELETVETGKFGNRYDGVSDADGVVTASFADTGSTIYLSFDGFDVDQGDEIELFLNGTSLGFLEAGVNKATAPYVYEITPEMQNAGGVNELRFEQAIDNNYAWGVTNILVSETEPTVPQPTDIQLELETVETGKFGNRYDGVSDADGVVTASFADTGSTIYLSFEAFDVDQGDEIELFLNGTSLGFLEAGVNNATAPYVYEITPEMQNAGGVNELRFEQAIDPAWTWGVTNILVSEDDPFHL